ncbi:hypothetical protein SLE2022_369940 [Rubroshorea leprosula]
MQRKSLISELFRLQNLNYGFNQSFFFSSEKTHIPSLLADPDDSLYADVPKPQRDKSERKPYPTPMKVLIERAKKEREVRKAQPCRVLEDPPGNGLLVPELVDVAHRVYRARESLLSGVAKLIRVVPVQRCRFCHEVHIGPVGHEIRTCTGPESGVRSATHAWRKGRVHDVVFFPKCFHLYDRVGKPRVTHDEWHSVKQIPAVVELCIQAGVDIGKYPTKRRTKPVYCIEGRIVDFESDMGNEEMGMKLSSQKLDPSPDSYNVPNRGELIGNSDSQVSDDRSNNTNDQGKNLTELSIMTMGSWFEMEAGVKKIMEKYSVWTCGYCPEVQVGPKGHKVRMCKATKHQSRNGLHAWQEATIDDLVGPNYVWHVRDPNGPALHNNLKRYYGKAPAVVELCVQAGAPIPDQYKSMMRLDVVTPERDEVDLVA